MSPVSHRSAPYVLPATEKQIAAIPHPEAGELCAWHPDVKGLHLRLTPSSAVWRYQYRDPTGATRKVTLGHRGAVKLADAVKAAKAHAGDIAKGGDPAAKQRAAKAAATRTDTFGARIEEYLAWKGTQKRASTVKELHRYLKEHLASLHRVRLDDLDQALIDSTIEKVRKGETAVSRKPAKKPSAKTAKPVKATSRDATGNRATSALSGYLRWLGSKGRVKADIAFSARLLPKAAEKSRERVLAPEEMLAIWKATADGSTYSRIIRILLLTASRSTEIGSLKWDEIEEAMIVIPGTRMKAGQRHAIPLLPEIRRQLPEKPEGSDNPYVFGASGESGFSGWSKGQNQLMARLPKMPHWTRHDLRRTFSSTLHDDGAATHDGIETCLAHRLPGVAAVYARGDRLEIKKATLQLWFARLRKWGLDLGGMA